MHLCWYSVINKQFGNVPVKHKKLDQYFNSNWSNKGSGRT